MNYKFIDYESKVTINVKAATTTEAHHKVSLMVYEEQLPDSDWHLVKDCPICHGTGEQMLTKLKELCHKYPLGLPELVKRGFTATTGKTPDEAANQTCQRCNGTGIDPYANLAAKQIDSVEKRY